MLMMRIVNFSKFFFPCTSECFPKIKVKLRQQKQFNPWITKGIRKSSKKKQKLYEKKLKKERNKTRTSTKYLKTCLNQ